MSFRLFVIAFGLGFGAVVAYRLGAEALSVIAGALIGIGGSLPVALLILYALRRSDKKSTAPAESGWTPYAATPPHAPLPQIIVVGGQPGAPAPYGYGLPAPQIAAPPPPATNSRFNLIPYDTEDDV